MIVLTAGTFDLFHSGHVALLRRCADLAEVGPFPGVYVGLNTDRFVTQYRGRPPTFGYTEREAMLAACRYVDAVLPNDQADGTIRDLLAQVRPDILAVGDDWRGRDYLAQVGLTKLDLEMSGLRLVYLPYTPGPAGSSSAIKRLISETTSVAAAGDEVR